MRQSFFVGDEFFNNSGSKFIIEKYDNSRQILVRFVDTGFLRVTSVARIIDGAIKDLMAPSVCGVGFLGGDRYSKSNSEIAYNKWKDMLVRCYSVKYQDRNPSYVGCTVVDEWHNFQNFAAWFDDNYPSDGKKYQLDKDFIHEGNKVYSPENCCFLEHCVNSQLAHSKSYSFLSPEGEEVNVFNLNKFCAENGLHSGHMSSVASGKRKSHKGWKQNQRCLRG